MIKLKYMTNKLYITLQLEKRRKIDGKYDLKQIHNID